MYGIQRDIVADSPVKLLCQPGGKERPRKRALAENELIVFIQNIDKACRSRRKARVLMVLLLTLQRRGELGLAEWKEFDFNARLWRIPNGHAKGGRGHVLPSDGLGSRGIESPETDVRHLALRITERKQR
jgi:integrase